MITALYTGILGLIFVFLSARVIMSRIEHKTGTGDAGNPDLVRRIRVHGNFAEYVPIGLIIIFALDNMLLWEWILHILGIALVSGRIIHAYAITKDDVYLRKVGMMLTLGMIAIGSLLCLYVSFF